MAIALVTGGAGFIGSHLAAALLQEGYGVRVLDDLSTGRRENLDGLEVDLMVGDIRDADLVRKAVRGSGLVFHQAAMISVPSSMEDPLTCFDVNLMGGLQVLLAAREQGVRRVILASSAAVYGEAEEPVHEESPLKPKSPYASSKQAMEQAARLFASIYGLDTVCLRYFNVFGPRQSPDSPYAAVIPIFIHALLAGKPPTIFGDGRQRRDFVYVEDVVRANLLAATVEGAVGKVFNISAGESVSILELAGMLRELVPWAPEPEFGPSRPGDILFSQADVSRARRVLGFSSQVSFGEGLRRTLEWFRSPGPSRRGG